MNTKYKVIDYSLDCKLNKIFKLNKYEPNISYNNSPRKKELFIIILDKEVIEIAKQYEAIIFDYEFSDTNNFINSLPDNIKYITFDYESYFNKPIYNYPASLIYIKFGIYFDQSIDYLPNTVKYLILGENFSQNINNIPISIEHLHLDIMFNHPINNLSDNIRVLYLFSDNFIHPILKLPNKLEKLKIYTNKSIILDDNCFAELTNLVEVELGYVFNSSLDNIKWTDSLKILKFGECFNQRLDNLPKFLESIEVSEEFDLFENIISFPITLKEFIYNDGFPKCIYKTNRLKELEELFPNIKFIYK
jgi:hypothetical protein